jgi:hypothetical protein
MTRREEDYETSTVDGAAGFEAFTVKARMTGCWMLGMRAGTAWRMSRSAPARTCGG